MDCTNKEEHKMKRVKETKVIVMYWFPCKRKWFPGHRNERNGSSLSKSFDTCLSNLNPLLWLSPCHTSVVKPQVCRTCFLSGEEVHPFVSQEYRLWTRGQKSEYAKERQSLLQGKGERSILVCLYLLYIPCFLLWWSVLCSTSLSLSLSGTWPSICIC